LIDMYKGASSAVANAMQLGPIAGPIVGGLQAAAIVAMGIANIKKISATKFDGGGGSGGGGVAPSMSGGSIGGGGGTQAPQFTLAGATGINQINQSVNQQQPVKAYVVSHEISTAQSLDRNKIETAVL
jgi:hypothetical protein